MSQSPPSTRDLPAAERRFAPRLRAGMLAILVGFGAAYFIHVVNRHYPVSRWLFWRYAEYWLLSITWSAACLGAGHALVKRLLGRVLPLLEHLAVSFAAGLYVFYLGMQLAGLAGLYGAAVFVAMPALMLAAGARPLWRTARRLARHLRFQRRSAQPAPAWTFPIVAFGLLGVGMVYFSTLTPDNVAFDSRWQHLALAEHYVAEGAARRFPEGWFIGSSPHLASFIYTWAFLLPKSTLFDRVELSAHLEFVTFLWTLVGIPALVRLMVPRARGRAGARRSLIHLSWVARFLFPGILLYDSSLCTGADHMAAAFAVPMYTLLLRAWEDLSPRLCLLLSMMLAGAFLTKYTGGITLLAAPVIAVLVRAAWLLVARLRRGRGDEPRGAPAPSAWYAGPLAAFAGGLGMTAPHWIKNWVFYGDPLYPLLHRRLALHPWTPDSSDRFEWGFIEDQLWRPDFNLAGIKESLKAVLSFSFEPNDWATFHGKVPVFGSLFTLLFFCLPLLRGTRRLWGLFSAAHLGVFLWYWVHHQDRYLQTLLPWMAAATAGVLVLAWQAPEAAQWPRAAVAALRAPLVGLVALQIVWGGDVYFIPGHAMIKSPIKVVADLISSGYRRDFKDRDTVFEPFSDVARVLPKGAKVLIHEHHPHLGIEAMSVNDFSVNQGGISYGQLRSPREVYDLLRGFGVTHLLWVTEKTRGFETLAGDLVFLDFATTYGAAPRTFGSFTLAEMPAEPPADGRSDVVLAVTCGRPAPGLYHLPDLNAPVFGPLKFKYPPPFKQVEQGNAAELAEEADYLVVETKCSQDLTAPNDLGFRRLGKRKEYDLWDRESR